MKYTINGILFKTEKAIEDYAKGILYDNALYSCVEGEAFEFILAYFQYFHHRWHQKQGCGIANIRRVKEPNYGKYRAFSIERIDGSSTDIAYRISNIKVDSAKKDFKAALRLCIDTQILAFKNAEFAKNAEVRCKVSNEILEFNTCEADHFNPTFDKIVNDFINTHKIEDFAALLSQSNDNQTRPKLADEFTHKKFYEYHSQVASLRLVTSKVNRQRSKNSL